MLSGAESLQPRILVLARENDGVGREGTSTARRADASVNENRGPL